MSEVGSDARSKCVCIPGTSGLPGNAALNPSDSLTQCELICCADVWSISGGPCSLCAVNTFAATSNATACKPCAANQVAAMGSQACSCAMVTTVSVLSVQLNHGLRMLALMRTDAPPLGLLEYPSVAVSLALSPPLILCVFILRATLLTAQTASRAPLADTSLVRTLTACFRAAPLATSAHPRCACAWPLSAPTKLRARRSAASARSSP